MQYQHLANFKTSEGYWHDRSIFRPIVKDIYAQLNIPQNLSEFGIFKKDKEKIMNIMQTQQIGFDQNPIDFKVNIHFSEFIDKFLE